MKKVQLLAVVLVALGLTLLVSHGQAAGRLGSNCCATDGCGAVASCDAGCSRGCDSGCDSGCCGTGFGCCNRAFGTSFYSEFLYLRPRNEGVEYAVPIDGQIQQGAVPLQQGRTATVDPDFQPGFRIGFDTALTDCGSIYGEYTYYRNKTDDAIDTTVPLVLQSLVLHPAGANAANFMLSAAASERVDFDIVDVGYRYNLWGCNQNNVGIFAGARYARLIQQFRSEFDFIPAETVDAGVNFDGVGPRIGLDGNFGIGRGLFMQGKVSASFLGGEYRASYTDALVAGAAAPVATTTLTSARFSTIVDGELTVGWQDRCGRFRAAVGYSISDWCNVTKPAEFISGVQANRFHAANELGQTALIFDGAMARMEVNF